MKSIFNTSSWAFVAAIIAVPFFVGCGEEPTKAGIDETKKAEIEVDEEEMAKPTASVGVAD